MSKTHLEIKSACNVIPVGEVLYVDLSPCSPLKPVYVPHVSINRIIPKDKQYFSKGLFYSLLPYLSNSQNKLTSDYFFRFAVTDITTLSKLLLLLASQQNILLFHTYSFRQK